jgi:hypothetical protein
MKGNGKINALLILKVCQVILTLGNLVGPEGFVLGIGDCGYITTI